MDNHQCDNCGGDVTHCSLCGRRQFHITFSDDGRVYKACASCDVMRRWPMVICDLSLAQAVARAIHPSNVKR